MKITLLGRPGCQTCAKLEMDTINVLASLGIEARLEHIYDPEEVRKYNVAPPAFLLDGTVKTAGRAPSQEEIKAILSNLQKKGGSQGCQYCK